MSDNRLPGLKAVDSGSCIETIGPVAYCLLRRLGSKRIAHQLQWLDFRPTEELALKFICV